MEHSLSHIHINTHTHTLLLNIFDIFPMYIFRLLWSQSIYNIYKSFSLFLSYTRCRCDKSPVSLQSFEIVIVCESGKSCEWYVKINHYSPLSNLIARSFSFVCSLPRTSFNMQPPNIRRDNLTCIMEHRWKATRKSKWFILLFDFALCIICKRPCELLSFSGGKLAGREAGYREVKRWCVSLERTKLLPFCLKFPESFRFSRVHLLYPHVFSNNNKENVLFHSVLRVLNVEQNDWLKQKCSTVNIRRRNMKSKHKIISDQTQMHRQKKYYSKYIGRFDELVLVGAWNVCHILAYVFFFLHCIVDTVDNVDDDDIFDWFQ